jgi:autotransporter-associated beta strand protein
MNSTITRGRSSKAFFALLFSYFICALQSINAQAILPISRTAWAAPEPVGWTNAGCTQRTTSSACSGNDATIFDTNGDSRTIFFSGMPDLLSFKLNKASMSGASKMVVEESINGTIWTTIGNYGTASDAASITDCAVITLGLNSTTRYVRWKYTKATGNCDLDDVSISQGYLPTKLVVTAITPNPPYVGNNFSVTVQAQDASNNLGNVLTMTAFSLTTNGNAGIIGGTVLSSFNARTNSVTLTNISLSTVGTGATIIATRTSGDVLTTGTSAAFDVVAPPENDECSGAITIIADALPIIATSLHASQSLAPITCNGYISTGVAADVWFKFVTTNSNHTITVAPSANYDAVVDVLKFGTCSNSTTTGNCADLLSFNETEVVDIVNLPIGATFYFRVYHAKGGVPSTPTFTVSVTTAQQTWSNTSSSVAWVTPSNWSTGYYPTIGQIAHFANAGTATAASINFNNVDIVGLYSLATLDVTAARTRPLSISNSSTIQDGVLKLTGETLGGTPNVIIQNAGSDTLTLIDGKTKLMGLLLGNATDNVIVINGLGGVNLRSVVSGVGKKLTKTGSGAGILTLWSANTYTGLTTVTAGRLKLNHVGGTTIPITNDVNITGGTLQISTDQTLNNLTLNGGNVIVDDGVTLTINGVLTLTSGKITLGTGNLIMGDMATILPANPTAASYIVTSGTGTLTQSHAANAAKTYPIGPTDVLYDPSVITPDAACIFKVKVASPIDVNYTLTSTQTAAATPRQWDITLVSGTPTVTLALTSSDLTRAPSGTAGTIGHWNGTYWEDIAAAYAMGTWTASGVSNFSPFIVSQPDVPLSISLKDFTVFEKNDVNVLSWTTTAEKNNAYFDVQYATNDLNFKNIAQIKGRGTTRFENYYNLEHTPNPALLAHYYRLRYVDFNGFETFSKIIAIRSNPKKTALMVYPNVASDKLMVQTVDDKTRDYSIFNLFGQAVQTGQLSEQKELIISQLSAGTYFLRMGNATVKFFKN